MKKEREEIEMGNSDGPNVRFFYKSMKSEISAFIYDEKIVEQIGSEFVLLVVERGCVFENESKVEFSFHVADPECDWIVIINSLIIRAQNVDDRFPFMYIIWFLNNSNWGVKHLIDAIIKYERDTQLFILKWLQKICRCLSFNKQQKIKEVANFFHFDYQVYLPCQILNSLEYITPAISWKNYNLFELVDHILDCSNDLYLDKNGEYINYEVNTDSSNEFLCLYKWLHSNEPFINYELLKSIYPLVSYKHQLQILNRYFHDVRLGNTNFDKKIVEQFRENKHEVFMRYRYSINTPCCKIKIGNQLLCDCILTLDRTQGRLYQSFNGIFDLIINSSDIANPNIDLGLTDFLPCCKGGAVYNDSFSGFIDYSILVSLDSDKFTRENLFETIKDILDSIGERKKYFTCKYDDKNNILDEKSKCIVLKEKLECVTTNQYEDQWIISTNDNYRLNLFLKKPIKTNILLKNNEINMTDISVDKLKESICDIALKYKDEKSNLLIIPSKVINSFECNLLFKYSKASKIRIYPQISYLGIDLFGIKNTTENATSEEDYKKKESMEVASRILLSLKSILKSDKYNGEYYEISYDKRLLEKVLRLYYFRNDTNQTNTGSRHTFLKRKHVKSYALFCAPQLSKINNYALNIPFHWCRGDECFKIALDNQFLDSTFSWNEYTLFHLSEIIGYPQLRKTKYGDELNNTISSLIVIANKAMKKFRQLKCNTCGHLMLPVKEKNFNRYNNYYCINPTCLDFEKVIYLNYCHNCKKELIDSRNTMQCPNGWYICPTCLSCCNDQIYERTAQKYVISHYPIPERILSYIGKGHNDKNIYYCPYCGSRVKVYNETSSLSAYCNSCNKSFNYNKL